MRERTEEEIKKHSDGLSEINIKLSEEADERKRTVEELREAKEELEKLIGLSIDPIVVGDSTGHVVKPNRAFLKMIGFSQEEVIGEPMYRFSPIREGTYESLTGEQVTISEDFFKENSEMIAQLFEEGRTNKWMTYLINKENKLIPVTENILFLQNDKGERIGTFGIIRDITEQKKAELKLVKARETAMAQ